MSDDRPRFVFGIGRVGVRVDADGNAVQVDGADCEKAACVVCADGDLDALFPDNVFAACAWCGRRIQYRPDAPSAPPKVCIACAASMFGPVEGRTH